MQLQTLEQDDIINVRWASEDPNPGVKEKRRRQTEIDVLEHVKAQLPIVGDRGTVFDYDGVESKPGKKTKVVVEEGDDDWEEYCRQYYEYYGKYPESKDGGKDGDGKDVVVKGNGERLQPGIVGPTPKIKEKGKKVKQPLVANYASDSD